MIHAVRCSRCRSLSRVETAALGHTVACPHCGLPFTAAEEATGPAQPPRATRARPLPASDPIPVVHPARRGEHHDSGHDPQPVHGPSPLLFGLILLPLGIPLLWLMAPLVTNREPVFSFAAPVAIAISLIGLGLGMGFAHGWTHGTRVRGVLMLVMLGYFSAGFLFFLKKEWAEEVKRRVGPGPLEWKLHEPEDKSYRVQVPGQKQRLDDSPLPGWAMTRYRFSQDNRGPRDMFDIVFEVAHGTPPDGLAEAKWLESAEALLKEGCDGEFTAGSSLSQQEETRVDPRGREVREAVVGREFTLTEPDGATRRFVRVYCYKQKVFYLAVEGPFLPADADYVKKFFNHFYVNK